MQITRHSYVIAVPDLQVSSAFYRDVLGFTIHQVGDPGWLFFRSGDCTIMAGECKDAIHPSELGDHSYFAYLQIKDVGDFYNHLLQKKVGFCKELRDEPWGMREFGVVTVDGHRIMFAESLDVR